jgi:hypothetical protein
MVIKIVVFLSLVAFAAEVAFRWFYRRLYGKDYHVAIKFPWHRSYVIPHPFLSFIYKKHEIIDQNQRLAYDLWPNRYLSFKNPLRINNYGRFGSDIEIEKRTDTLRIACIGDSTTANNIADEERDYSYPLLLEKFLSDELREADMRIEVNNWGLGGWVSADIVIDFLLNVLPTNPDYVILYHGFTDLHLYLMNDFSTDYSHGRRNLGEVIQKIKMAYYLPKIKHWHFYEFLKDRVFGTGNVRNDLLNAITCKKPGLTRDYRDLRIEQAMLRNIAIVCRHYRIKCILSSYAFFPFNSSLAERKMHEGILRENELMAEMAKEFDLQFVDQYGLIPQKKDYFLDWVHLTPMGMNTLARNFGALIVKDVKGQIQSCS